MSSSEVDEFLEFFQNHVSSDLSQEPCKPLRLPCLSCLIPNGPVVLGTMMLPKTLISVPDKFFPKKPSREGVTALDRLAEQSTRLKAFYNAVSAPIPGEAVDKDPLFPGQQYMSWSLYDRTGMPTTEHERVLQLIGSIVGIEPSALEASLVRMEGRLLTKQSKASSRAVLSQSKQNYVPWEGYESRAFGALRHRGGITSLPGNLASRLQEKEDQG